MIQADKNQYLNATQEMNLLLLRVKKAMKKANKNKLTGFQTKLAVLPYIYNIAEFLTWDLPSRPIEDVNLYILEHAKQVLVDAKVPLKLEQSQDTFDAFLSEWLKENMPAIADQSIDGTIPETMIGFSRPVATCRRCGRVLTNPDSVARGIGKICLSK